MEIKLKKIKIRFIRADHYTLVAEELVKTWLKIAFFISPFAIWKLYELISEVL